MNPNMNMMQQLMGMGGMGGRGIRPVKDINLADTSEQVYISSLALLKMLKHGTFLPHSIIRARRGPLRSDGTDARRVR